MSVTMLKGIEIDELTERGLRFYEENLKSLLEPGENGKAVAIHVPTSDYATGKTHAEATRLLLQRHEIDGQVVSRTIGPPTEKDILRAQRYLIGGKA